MGLVADAGGKGPGAADEFALLRCVDERGNKLTAVFDAHFFRSLLDSGEARDPNGMTIPKRGSSLVVVGWRRAS